MKYFILLLFFLISPNLLTTCFSHMVPVCSGKGGICYYISTIFKGSSSQQTTEDDIPDTSCLFCGAYSILRTKINDIFECLFGEAEEEIPDNLFESIVQWVGLGHLIIKEKPVQQTCFKKLLCEHHDKVFYLVLFTVCFLGYVLLYRLSSLHKEMIPPESLAFIENYVDLDDDEDFRVCRKKRAGSIILEKTEDGDRSGPYEHYQ